MTTTERQIEHDFIAKLRDLKYTYRPDIRDRAALEDNFRQKFDALNNVSLTDSEFDRLLSQIITSDVFDAARILRERSSFERDDGSTLHFTLVNTTDWCKNCFEVVHQLRTNTRSSHHRYDVILLINGVPVVQVELKALQVSPRRAMEQIVDYKKDPGNGYTATLLCFVQLFVVSNRHSTWYFANNNETHFRFHADERFLPVYQCALRDNTKITHLDSFAEHFLAKCTLGHTISRYMVLVQSERKLLLMRPYQVFAVQALVDCIHQNCGNGYIWHTTGSGKTLTSFKAATLLRSNPAIDKCLFVVDRKDLDRQTREEFNRFQPGCVEENTNTESLVCRLCSTDHADKVIVTTIQKLGLALDPSNRRNYKTRLDPLRTQRMVFIFDECHRSQFGENHKAIKDFFPNAQLFGFTGTPIFEQNASQTQVEDQQASLRTTDDLFHRCLHRYTITHAIEDRNVLRFHVDYFKPRGKPPKPGEGWKKEKIIETILAKHDAATGGRKFNALLATASISDAIEYFDLFQAAQKKRAASDATYEPLSIACLFSPPAEGNRDVQQIQEDLPQEREDNKQDPDGKKAALRRMIADFNERFGTNHRLSDFDLYHQDVQKRIKDQQFSLADMRAANPQGNHAVHIDITIVVDMLLTGFDSKYLNTLYLDKNLRYHGLIQAFSRTNRVLNDSKPYGNILDFRQQQGQVEDAIALFSGERIDRAREIWLVDPAPKVIENLRAATQKLSDYFVSQGLPCAPESVHNLRGDAARTQFVVLYKDVQRVMTQLGQYTDLTPSQVEQIDLIAPPDTLHGFRGVYLDTAKQLRDARNKKGSADDAEMQQLDFEFVLFASALIDHDYIMRLIARLTEQQPGKLTLSRDQLIGLVQADAKFLDERDDIADYIRSLPVGEALSEAAIRGGYEEFKARKMAREVAAMATKHGVDGVALQGFVDLVLRRCVFDGEQLTELFEPLGLGWIERGDRELELMEELGPFLRRAVGEREISGLRAYEEG